MKKGGLFTDMSRLNEKINELEEYLNELAPILPHNLNEYLDNLEKKAACERYFEKIIEATVDIAFLLIKEKSLKMPEEDKEAFDILANEGIIPEKLSEKIKDAKGMRNIIAHEYGKVDDKIVFHAITAEICKDVGEFIKFIKRGIK